MDNKPFRSIEQQVRLLQGRGVATNEATPTILLREGYYAVVNGYGKPFIDAAKTAAAHDDRFCEGTTFDAIYQLFLFDRDLRALTFRSIMSVEGTLRSVLSHTFCEHHRADEAYLDKSCYTRARGYLRGEDRHPGDLEWLINTLRHHANGHLQPDSLEDSPEGEGVENARVSWYRENYIGRWYCCYIEDETLLCIFSCGRECDGISSRNTRGERRCLYRSFEMRSNGIELCSRTVYL